MKNSSTMKSPLSQSFLPAHSSLRSVGVDRFRLLLNGWGVKVLSLMLVVMVGGESWGQALTDGGFENSPSSGVWTINNGSTYFTGSYSTSTPRTGSKKFLTGSFYNSTNATPYRNDYLQNSTSISMGSNTYLHILAWATGSNTNTKIWFSTNTSSYYYSTVNLTTSMARYSADIPSSDLTASGNQIQIGFSTSSNTNRIFQLEDVIAYTDQTSTSDLVKPVNATAFTNGSISGSSVGFSWTNGSDAGTGIQNTIILRTTNLSAATPLMNDQGIYSTSGGTSGPNIVTTDWAVLSTSVSSSSNSFTDVTVANGTSYLYAVVHRDLAFNYSTALVSGTILATTTCATPTTQATSLSASGIAATGANYTFTRGNGTGGAIVVARATATSAIAPTSGTTYTPSANGSFIGTTTTGIGNVVINNGSLVSGLSVSNLTSATQYTLTAYEYNTISTCYNTTSPASISFYTLCNAPTTNSATLVGSKSMTLNWASVTGASSYKLDVSIESNFSSFVSGFNDLSVAGTSQSVNGLSPETTYYYRVRAVNAASASSANSTTGSQTTIAAATQFVIVNAPSTGSSGVALSSFTVEARNGSGALDVSYFGTITINKVTGSGTLTGSAAVASSGGVSTFSNIIFSGADTYTINATGTLTTSATSGNIVVSLANASPILWSSATGSAWLTGANWTGGSYPTNAQVAQFNANPTAATGVGINFNNTTNAGTQSSGSRIQEVGAIEVVSTRPVATIIGNSSSTPGASGTLRLNGVVVNGVANTIIRHNNSNNLTINNTQGAGTQTMGLALGNATNNIINIDGTGGVTISSIISGSGKLTKSGSGSGVLTLSGTNTYSGGTVINAGAISIGADANIGNGSVTLGGGTLAVTTGFSTSKTMALTTSTTSTIDVASGQSLTANGIVSGSGNLTVTGSGTLILSAANTFTGTTTISAGTINVTGITGITSTSFTASAQSVTFSSATPTNGDYQLFNGPVSVTTQSFSSNAGASKSVTFNYSTGAISVADAASITSFSPTSGGAGTSVVIIGTYLTSTTDVKFNGTSVGVGNFTVNSATQITATVPAGLSAGGLVSIVKNSTTVNSATNFVVNYYLASGGSITDISGFGQDAAGTDGNTPTSINSNNYSNFYIVNNTSVTQNANITLGTGSKIIVGDGINATTLIIAANKTTSGTIDVKDNGTLTLLNPALNHTLGTLGSNSSTVVYNASGAQTVATKDYINLTIDGSGVKTVGTASVTGTLSLTSGTLDIGANTLTLAGSVSRTNGNIDADAGTVSFGNSADLSLPTSLFSGNIYNLSKASGAGSVTLNDNLTVTNELTSAASTGAFIIPSSKVLTVSGTGKATINGTLTNNGTFTLNSGATLLQGSGGSITGGTYNVKQNITGAGSGTPTGRYWYVGSPVSVATSAVYDAAGANILKYYSESANAWQEITDNTSSLEVGRGYFVQAATGTTELNFTGGTINNNTYTLNVTRNTSTNAFRGYNLLTNPYPSYLDWDNVTRSNVGTTMWYRAANSGGTMVFDTYNVSAGTGTNNNGAGVVTNFIPPMQSFWVNVPQGQTSGTVSFGNDQRSHYSTGVQGLRSSAQDFPAFLRLNLLDGSFVDQTILYMKPAANNTFDEYDSEKMFLGGVPQFYSTVNAKKLVLNGMKNQKARTSVPLTMELPTSKSYTFQAEEFNIEDGLILLEDKQEGVIQDLTINPTYSFFGNAGTNATRFVVHFQLANAPILVGGPQELESLGSDELMSENIQIISNNQGKVTIRLDEGFKPEGSIRIFDASGRHVEQTDFNDQETTIQLNEQAGMYFVEVTAGKLMVKKKIVIN
jgi:autotransporter-associated beta strand protein